MPPKMRRRVPEDPNNTWNHQLMEACLRHSIPDAEALLESGADPVAACEDVSFYKEPLPPLIALLLLGQYNTESVAMMKWLLDHGASVSQNICLDGKDLQTSPSETGTVLHLFVQLGQPAALLDLLMLIGEQRPVPWTLQKRLPRGERLFTPATSTNTVPPGGAGSNTRGQTESSMGSGSGKRSGRSQQASSDPAAMMGMSNTNNLVDTVFHFDGNVIDFEARTSLHGWTAMDLALQKRDATIVQLLLYYGAPDVFHRLVNGCQTALARACATGDRELVEFLLDAGDCIDQISLDGRYTLIHYAAGQPAILDVLLARGLSIDAKNAFGETALDSIICYGQGLNAEYAIRETPRSSDAAKLSALPTCALQNYILTPFPSLVASSSKTVKISNGAGAGSGVDMDYPSLVQDADAWWYFASHSNAWMMIQNLRDHGADVHGDLPQLEGRKMEERSASNKYIGSPVPAQLNPYSYASGFLNNSQIYSEGSDSIDNLRGSHSLLGGSGPDVTAEKHSFEKDATRPSVAYVTHMTPLMHAIVSYHPELIRRIALEFHADPMVQDAKGACALHYAAMARHASVMVLFLSPLVAPTHSNFDINTQDCLGRTPLHYAAMHGNSSVVRAMLGFPSLNPGKADYAGRTPLHLAVLAREAKVVEILLQFAESAVTEAQSMAGSISIRKKSSIAKRKVRQISSDAQAMEHVPAIDVEAEDSVAGLTALEMAVYITRDAVIVRLLLTIGFASVRHVSGLPTGGSLLHRTVADGCMEIMLLLLENFAEPTEVDNLEQTALHLATLSTHACACDMVRELLRFGAAPEARSGCTLDTPILIASRRGEVGMLDYLLHQHEEFGFGGNLQGARGTGQRDRTRHTTRARQNAPCSPVRRNVRGSQKLPSPVQRRGRTRGQQGTSDVSVTSECNESSINDVTTATHNNNNNNNDNSSSNVSAGDLHQTPSLPNFRAASSSGGVSLEKNGDVTKDVTEVRKLALNPQHLLLADGHVRTALHHLCSHSDASKQAALLPYIQEILACELAPTLAMQLDADGRLPVHDACAAGYSAALRELLSRDDGSSAFFLDSRGCIPLHYAVISNDPATIMTLVRGAEVWLPCTLKGGSSAVDDRRSVPIANRILQHHSRPEPQHQDYGYYTRQPQQRLHQYGINPLHKECRRIIWINTVWEYLNVHDGMGRTPLILAAELGHLKASKTLMKLLKACDKSKRHIATGMNTIATGMPHLLPATDCNDTSSISTSMQVT